MTKSDRGSIIIKMEASPPAEATSPPPAPAPVAAAPAPAAPAPAAGDEPPPKKAKKAKAKDDGATTRKGKWTIEETEFTTRIIELFNTGLLELPEGATLRSYLAQKLSCDPMRITKKFSGASCLGKRVFHSSVSAAASELVRAFIALTIAPRSQTGRQRNSASAVAPSAASVAAAQQELSVLEARFVDACIRSTESKDARMIDLEARFLHSHDVVSTPAIDAFIMQSCQPLWDPDGVKSGGAPARAYAPAPTSSPAAGTSAAAGSAPPAPPPPSFPPEPPSFPPARPPAAAPPRPAHHRVDAWPADALGPYRDQLRRAPRRARRAAPQPRAAPPALAARPAGDTVPANLLLGFVQSLHRSDSHSELVDFVEDVRTKTDR
ncbi:hypothetical protein JL722_4613 [Aureococcus anophagefferens]|nr:hypothetical protein JL722_4613 [Aureococcus anophagefferens]